MRKMAKARTTLILDEDVLRAVKVKAARHGKGNSQVIEEALRRDLGFELLDRVWARSDLDGDEAMELAAAEVHAMRGEKRSKKHP
jgi:plasmid stability protein